MASLAEHLARYGIHHFADDSYWSISGEAMGPDVVDRLNALREPLWRDIASAADWAAFYDYIAPLEIGGPVHSMKTDAIRASGEAVSAHLSGVTRMLDLGCSLGYLTTWYAGQLPDAEVHGIDCSAPTIAEAERVMAALDLPATLFHCGDVTVDLPPGPFDLIVDTQTLCALPDLPAAAAALAGVLAADGTLVTVGALPTENDVVAFVEALAPAGLHPHTLLFAPFADCGNRGAFPALTFRHTAPVAPLNVRRAYAIAFGDWLEWGWD